MPSIMQNQEQVLALNAVTSSLNDLRKIDMLLASDCPLLISNGEKKPINVELDAPSAAKARAILQSIRVKIAKNAKVVAKKNRIMLDKHDLELLDGKPKEKKEPARIEQDEEVVVDDMEAQESCF